MNFDKKMGFGLIDFLFIRFCICPKW
ncbi:hypothetical protein HID58_032868 [Brassica napus]|uniref:Uncharacterized protein n=1 Tax=Brassica napus TaxID=3708 RepID=A0ABQ8BYH0_BRANA|nr:hypothetical protein HID58_032868 [Brassica napus]